MLDGTIFCSSYKKIKKSQLVVPEKKAKDLKNPPNRVFLPSFSKTRFLFQIRLLSLFYPFGGLTLYKKLKKTNEQSL